MINVARRAPLDAGHRSIGEFRLQRQYRLRFFACAVCVVAHQFKHLGDVLDILVAKHLRFVVGAEIIVAVGQTKPALLDAEDDLGSILEILC